MGEWINRLPAKRFTPVRSRLWPPLIGTILTMMVIVDALRIFTILAGGMLAFSGILLIRHWWGDKAMPGAQKFRFLALFGYGVATAILEAERLGKPFVWWQLPLLLFCTVCALVGVYKPMLDENWRRRPLPSENRDPFYDDRLDAPVNRRADGEEIQ